MSGLVLVALALLLVPAARARMLDRPESRWTIRHGSGRSQFRDDAIAFVLALSGELRAGSDPNRAIQACAQRSGIGLCAARAARMGGDVAAGLRADAVASRASLLASVAGAWDLAGRTGSSLADVLENLADGYRRTVEVRRSIAVELASPRATARLMSLLPALGVALAMVLGAAPLLWLTTTATGLACLVLGVGLNVVGYVWIQRIVQALEERL